jgi:hypothetical protein
LSLSSFKDFELVVNSEDLPSKYVLIPLKSAVDVFSSTTGVSATVGAHALTNIKRISVAIQNFVF